MTKIENITVLEAISKINYHQANVLELYLSGMRLAAGEVDNAKEIAEELDKVLQQKVAAKDALRKEKEAHTKTKETFKKWLDGWVENLTKLVGETELGNATHACFVEQINSMKAIAGDLK